MTAEAGQRRTERLPRAARVRRRPEYLTIQNRGRRTGGAHLLLFGMPGTGRLGITVSKKVGGAVARNRVKRWVRDCFRRARGQFPPTVDLVVVARPGSADAGHEAICRELRSLASRFGAAR
ncbi:MAG TPA: ribonuclease P protein component [Polyangia bacterium]|nr:ribonuclease P protein component [Polyangia bacterium]